MTDVVVPVFCCQNNNPSLLNTSNKPTLKCSLDVYFQESLLLRHHNEAESLHAVQKLEWEWHLKENTKSNDPTPPTIDELYVPMVQVSDDLDLLPA